MIPENGEDNQELIKKAVKFFQNMAFKIEKEITLVGTSGKKHHFDLIVKSDTDLEIREILVKIVDWKRAVGVDRLIRFERVLKDLSDKKGMIIANSFSDSAVKFAKRCGLIIYEKEHLQIPSE